MSHYFIVPYIESSTLYVQGSWRETYGTDYPDGSNDGAGTPTYWGYLAGINYGKVPKIFQAPGDPTQQPGGGWTGRDGTSYIHNGLAFPSWQQGKLPISFPNGTSQIIFFAESYSVTNGGAHWRSWWRYTHHAQWPGSPGSDPYSPNYVANPTYNPPFQVMSSPANAQWYLPQGMTPAGIAVCMGDGSAKIIGGSISPTTWYAANIVAANGMDTDW